MVARGQAGFCCLVFLILVGDYGDGFPVDSSPCISLIYLPCPSQVDRVGFLILCDWSAVGPRPEGLGLMAFSMVPGGIHSGDVGVFCLPYLALHAVFVPRS